jgi:site-specific recombinase XerD
MIQEFKNSLQRKNLSKNTYENYERDLLQFEQFIGKSLQKTTQKDIERFIDEIQGKNSPATVNRKISAIKSFFKFLIRQRYIQRNPSELVELLKMPKRLPNVPDTEELTDVLSIINDSKRDVVIFKILFYTGLRRSELINLKVKDINFKKGFLTVIGKGNKEREVPIHQSVLQDIEEYITSHCIKDYLFPSKRFKDKPMTTRNLNLIVSHWIDKAGFKGITPHRYRAHLATLLYRRGVDIKVIQDILGHESVNTTNIYTKSNLSRNLKDYNKAFTS